MSRSAAIGIRCLRHGVLLILLCLAPSVAAVHAADLTADEERGREIYFTGQSPSGAEITAYFGADRIAIPGVTSTCASCHGHDGTGRPESGVVPANITWKYLTKSYGHLHPSGLEHPPFDESSLKDYLRYGDYPGGERGDPAMPLYDMSDQDLKDLLAFMNRLGGNISPGVRDHSIRIGTLLPLSGPLASMGTAMRAILAAYLSKLNQEGGIHGRRLELVVLDSAAERHPGSGPLEDWLAQEDPFVLVSPFAPALEADLQAVCEKNALPCLGPFTLYPVENHARNRNLFYLEGGLAAQVRALIGYAGQYFGGSRIKAAVLYPEREVLTDIVVSAATSARRAGWADLLKRGYPEQAFDPVPLVASMKREGVNLLVFLGVEHEARALLAAARNADWRPRVLAAGVLSGRLLSDPPPGFSKRIFLAYPTLPRDRQSWALKELSDLMHSYHLPADHLQVTISAYVAAKVMVHALRLAGRNLDQPKFVSVLEKLYHFESGLSPPISYSANRRVGVSGSYILAPGGGAAGQSEGPVATWIEVIH